MRDVVAVGRRVAVLRRLDVLGVPTPRDQQAVARLAALATGAHAAASILATADQQVPLAVTGVDLSRAPLAGSLVARALATRDLVTAAGRAASVPGDPVVAVLDAAVVTAAPIVLDGDPLGALLVGTDGPLPPAGREVLTLVAERAAASLELRRTRIELALELGASHLQRRTDELTGLLEPRALRERAATELARHERHGNGLVVVVLELRGLAHARATIGDAGAELLLQRVARRLADAARSADVLGRWGEHRLVVVAPDTHASSAPALVARLRATIGAVVVEGCRLTCLAGVAIPGPRSNDVGELLRAADGALSRAIALDPVAADGDAPGAAPDGAAGALPATGAGSWPATGPA